MHLTREKVEFAMGARKYNEVFDHDGDNKADDARVDEAIAVSNALMYGLVNKRGFSGESVENLLADPLMVAAGAWIAADYGSKMKPGLLDPTTGKSVYHSVKEDALKVADQVAEQRLRLIAEQTAGAPTTSAGLAISQPIRPRFYVAPSEDDPVGPGGF